MRIQRVATAIRRAAPALLVMAMPTVSDARAEEPASDFEAHCMSCHTIGGGRLTGPDLKGVSQRRDRAWLARFIVEPATVIDSGDAYALKLRNEARGVVMPAAPGMTLDRAKALLDLIEAESLLEKSKFAGIQMSDRPFTEDDVRLGREIFLGLAPLENGGAACVSCHSVSGIGVLAGGGLGPELSDVYGRLNGRKGLGTWLAAPATSTMQALFAPHPLDGDKEILPLLAYFADIAQNPPESSQAATLIFILLGLAGTAAALMVFDGLWKGRFTGVRKALVAASSDRVEAK